MSIGCLSLHQNYILHQYVIYFGSHRELLNELGPVNEDKGSLEIAFLFNTMLS